MPNHYKRNHNVTDTQFPHQSILFQPLYLYYKPPDTVIDSMRTVDDPESASNDKHEGNDSGLLAESLI